MAWNEGTGTMRIESLESTDDVAALRAQYMQQTTAPLDGMWSCGFVPAARHVGIFMDDLQVGYACINDDGYLLQFYVDPAHQDQGAAVFETIISGRHDVVGAVQGAFVSTAEPFFLAHCLDGYAHFEVNALMYQRDERAVVKSAAPWELTPVEASQLPQAVDFAVASLGAPAEWLEGYFTRLIQRRELFGVRQDSRLVATGESRRFDEYQTGYVDLGVVVGPSRRGRGMATEILRRLVVMNESKGLKPMCSTEKTNLAAQKAIARAGFFAVHRILRFQG